MEKFLKLLHQYDELGGAGNHPVDTSFNKSLLEDIKHLQTLISKVLELNFELRAGDMYQDAAFHGNLFIHKDIYGRECPSANLTDYKPVAIMLRFSNFGRLFTIFSCSKLLLEAYPLEKIIELAVNVGFRYVPVQVLETRYNGVNNITQRYERPTHGLTASSTTLSKQGFWLSRHRKLSLKI